MTLPFWEPEGGQVGNDYADTEWDLFFIGGEPVPGIVEVDATPERKADDKSPAGRNGSTITFHGRKAATFPVKVRIWTPRQWSDFQNLVARIWPNGGAGEPKAYDLSHPGLQFVGISAAAVLSVSAPVPTGNKGERVITIRFVEYKQRDKKKVTKRLSGSKSELRAEFATEGVASNGALLYTPNTAQAPVLPSSDVNYSGPG